MARKIVDIGVAGNDGTGDSIRESFRKVNENFQELYSVFGQGGNLTFLNLTDTPSTYAGSADKFLLVNSSATGVTFKTLVGSAGITVNSSGSNAIITLTKMDLSLDSSPKLSYHLNAQNQLIGGVKDPDTLTVSQFNTFYGTSLTVDNFAITKGYADNRFVNVTGDTMTGYLSVPAGGTATQVPQAQAVVHKAGDTMTGFLTLHANPTSNLHATTKQYVDALIEGVVWKEAVQLKADVNVPLSGTVASMTALNIDSYGALEDGYRLLLTGQTTAANNGIYVYTVSGLNYTLTRTSDADSSDELNGAAVFVLEGTIYQKTGWVQTNHYLTTFDGQSWVQFTGAGTYSAGSGLSLVGAQFSHNDTSSVGNLSSDNSGNTFIQDISFNFDDFGHVTSASVVTGTATFTESNAFQTVAINTDSGYTWGAANTNTNQTADTPTDTLALVAGSGINLFTNTVAGTDAVKIEHGSTSTITDLTATARTYVTALTFDDFGHVTGVSTGSETVVDTNTTYSIALSDGGTGEVKVDLTAGGSGSGTDSVTFKAGTNVSLSRTNDVVTINSSYVDTTYGQASTSVFGLVKLGSDTVQSVAAGTVSTTVDRTYAIQTNASGQLVVNVPWTDTDTDTNTTYSISAESATGGVNLRLTASSGGTDDVKLASGGSTTVTRTDADTITITSTDTTYTVSDTTGQTGIDLTLSGTQISGTCSGLTTTSAVTFDTLTLTPRSTVPGSPINGMLAVADGTGWNPANNGKQTLVVYLGTDWVTVATAA